MCGISYLCESIFKGGSVDKMIEYMFSPFSRFEFFHQITERPTFVFAFARKIAELFIAKYRLS